MGNEDFSLLEDIVKKAIAETAEPENFDWWKFASEMEKGFEELGFRNDYKLVGGGV